MAGTYQTQLGSFVWQGTDTLATYTGTVVQPYTSVNLMTNEVAINNNLYSVYSMLYYTDLRVIDTQDKMLNQVLPDLQSVKSTLENATFSNYSAKLEIINKKLDALGTEEMISTFDAGFAWMGGILCALIIATIWRH